MRPPGAALASYDTSLRRRRSSTRIAWWGVAREHVIATASHRNSDPSIRGNPQRRSDVSLGQTLNARSRSGCALRRMPRTKAQVRVVAEMHRGARKRAGQSVVELLNFEDRVRALNLSGFPPLGL